MNWFPDDEESPEGIMRSIATDIRLHLPIEAVLPSEKIRVPETGEVSAEFYIMIYSVNFPYAAMWCQAAYVPLVSFDFFCLLLFVTEF